MDAWERFVRKAIVERSTVAVDALNISYKDRKNRRVLEDIARRSREANARLALAILLLKLNSKSTKALEWASRLTQGHEDVA